MVKPIGPKCNLDCAYCYYKEKERLYPQERSFRMRDATLETFVRDYIAVQEREEIPEIWFAWQGGEPTLLGLDFFRRVVAVQARHCPPGKTVRNSLQTNGTLLNAAWAKFFKEHDFLLGISLDGPRHMHDRYRVDRRAAPTFKRVMKGLALLQDGGVEFNVLTVVHRHNARHPRAVYRFLKENGVRFMQFIPLVERRSDGTTLAGPPQQDEEEAMAKVAPWSVPPKAYGDFLCGLFDEWVHNDVGHVFVQLFDVQLGLRMGGLSALCCFAQTCGQSLVLEHSGDLYACDHYVYPAYRLGNIHEQPLEILANSPRQSRFGRSKKDVLPRSCRECRFLFACNGGCPKHRFLRTPKGEEGLNYFCTSHKRFFAHIEQNMRIMADLTHRGQPPALIMEILRRQRQEKGRKPTAKVGRNDPCPCGSGRKFKNCCGAPVGMTP